MSVQAITWALDYAAGSVTEKVLLLVLAIDSRIIASFAPNQISDGARLESLRVTSSTEGSVIPNVYVRMKIGGNIFWATDFLEKFTTTTQGGSRKGGGGGEVKTTTYTYSCSFAVGLCEGPISGIGRIWADGKPFDLPGAVWRVYTGTDTQLPDPFITAKMGAGNQPNVFFDPKNSESELPYFSSGAQDDAIQRRYLEALIGYWSDPGNNPTSAVYSAPMIDMGECAVWCWDARPYPAWPGRSDVWGDTANWEVGHWLNGRLGNASLSDLVHSICARSGIDPNALDVSRLADAVPGFVIAALESPRASIAPLARYFGFDAVESQGLLRFVPRGSSSLTSITAADLVAADRPEGEDIEFTRGQETELPRVLKWRMLSADEDYEAVTVEARRVTVDSVRVQAEQFAIAHPPATADRNARRALFEAWIGRENATFALPPSRLALGPTDVVSVENDGRTLHFALIRSADAAGSSRTVTAPTTIFADVAPST